MAFSALPRPDMPARQPVEVTKVSSLPPTGKQAAPFLRGRSGETGDQLFKFAIVLCGLAVLAMLGLIVYELVLRSGPSWHAFGFKFFAGHDWDPVNEQFGAMPFVYGTLVSSLLALLIAVPLSIGVAVFTTEMCPAVLRGPLSFFVELLAAIPSVVYGLWAIFVLIPILTNYGGPLLTRTLGWTGLFQGSFYGVSMLAAGIILAIMIIPIISSITREVLMVVPQHQREAEIAKSLFAPGYTMASVLANEFSEATGNVYLSALIEIGLALFLVTIVVNALARFLVWTVTRGQPARANV